MLGGQSTVARARYPRAVTRPPDRWTHADVLAAVKNKAAETDALDFKRDLYTDTGEFAADLVSFANSGGGVIALGVEEDKLTRRASGAPGVVVSEGATNWMTQAAADLVEPRLEWRPVALEEAGQPSFYLLTLRAPREGLHAVRVGDGYRFYRRDGLRKRSMNIAEIAARFKGDRPLREMARELGDQSFRAISTQAAGGWLTLTTIPRAPGHWHIDTAAVDALRNERLQVRNAQPWLHAHLWSGMTERTLAGGRVLVRSDGEKVSLNYELFSDGSSVLSQSLRLLFTPENVVRPGDLVQRVYFLVEYAFKHAIRAEAGPRLHVLVEFRPPENAVLRFNDYGGEFAYSGPSRLAVEDAADLSEPPLLVARRLLTGIFQAFGVPEVEHVTADGRLSLQRWPEIDRTMWPPEVWATRA